MSAYAIRPCTDKDIGSLLGLVKGLAESQNSLDAFSATEEGLHNCFFGKRPSAEAVLAEVAGEVVGFAVFFNTNSTYKAKPVLFLEDLYVTAEHRGKGIGKGLFLHVVKLAHERGCARVDWLAYDWNKQALDFYFSLGATAREDVRPYRLLPPVIEKLAASS